MPKQAVHSYQPEIGKRSMCAKLFGTGGKRPGWAVWGDQADETYAPTWKTHSYNSSVAAK